MLINTTYFCALSTAPPFLEWLKAFDDGLYAALVAHAQTAPSCRANTEKMIWMLGEIQKRPDGEQRLESFLQSSFPYVLTIPSHTPAVASGRQVTPVFGNYDPSLLTIPMRKIFDNDDDAVKFVHDKAAWEKIIVDNKVYVEYVPQNLAHMIPSIPAANWKIVEYRAKISAS